MAVATDAPILTRQRCKRRWKEWRQRGKQRGIGQGHKYEGGLWRHLAEQIRRRHISTVQVLRKYEPPVLRVQQARQAMRNMWRLWALEDNVQENERIKAYQHVHCLNLREIAIRQIILFIYSLESNIIQH